MSSAVWPVSAQFNRNSKNSEEPLPLDSSFFADARDYSGIYRFTVAQKRSENTALQIVVRRSSSGYSARVAGAAITDSEMTFSLTPAFAAAPGTPAEFRGYRSPASVLLLALHLASKGSGDYFLPGEVDYPSNRPLILGADNASSPARTSVTLVSVSDTFSARVPDGVSVARVVRISHGREYFSELLISESGKAIAFAPNMSRPERYLHIPDPRVDASSESANPSENSQPADDTAAVLSVVVSFLKASVDPDGAEKLAKLIDWPSAFKNARTTQPDYADLPDRNLKAILLKPYLMAPPANDGNLRAATRSTDVKFPRDGVAEAALAGGHRVFRLRKIADSWLITELP